MIDSAEPFALTGVIVAEILQGLRRDIARIESFLRMWDLLDPVGSPTYRQAAAISRLARSNGIALMTIDSLIASVAVENRASLFTLDRDFSRLARIFPLRLYTVR